MRGFESLFLTGSLFIILNSIPAFSTEYSEHVYTMEEGKYNPRSVHINNLGNLMFVEGLKWKELIAPFSASEIKNDYFPVETYNYAGGFEVFQKENHTLINVDADKSGTLSYRDNSGIHSTSPIPVPPEFERAAINDATFFVLKGTTFVIAAGHYISSSDQSPYWMVWKWQPSNGWEIISKGNTSSSTLSRGMARKLIWLDQTSELIVIGTRYEKSSDSWYTTDKHLIFESTINLGKSWNTEFDSGFYSAIPSCCNGIPGFDVKDIKVFDGKVNILAQYYYSNGAAAQNGDYLYSRGLVEKNWKLLYLNKQDPRFVETYLNDLEIVDNELVASGTQFGGNNGAFLKEAFYRLPKENSPSVLKELCTMPFMTMKILPIRNNRDFYLMERSFTPKIVKFSCQGLH